MNSIFQFLKRCGRVFTAVGGMLLFGALTRADVVYAWNEAMLHFSTATPDLMAPSLLARTFAMTHMAMDEAVSAATRSGDPEPERLVAQRSAAVCAAHAVLNQLLPHAARSFEVLAQRHLGSIPDGPAKSRGMEAGRLVADRGLQTRAGDGWTELVVLNPPFGPTPNAAETAMSVLARGGELPPSPWLRAKPFAMKSALQFDVIEPKTFTREGGEIVNHVVSYPKLFKGVDQTAAADSIETCWSQHPLIIWNRIARQLNHGEPMGVREQARLLAGLNVALADATLAMAHSRYTVGSWRALQGEIWRSLDGQPAIPGGTVVRIDDTIYTDGVRVEPRYILIPPLPHYPSLAATIAGAAQAACNAFFKTDRITFTLPEAPGRPGVAAAAPRTFESLSMAAKENAFVVSLGGRFSREACVAGYILGADVGGYIGKRTFANRR